MQLHRNEGMNRYKNIIGVDPGKEGFITVMFDGGGISHFPVPKQKNEVDLHALGELVMRIAEAVNVEDTLVAIEKVHAIAGSSSAGTFTFGGIYYALQMAFTMLEFPIILVAPKQWQKEIYAGVKPNKDKKVMSISAAKMLFPNYDLRRSERCIKPDDNLTDSLLIAEYARRKYR